MFCVQWCTNPWSIILKVMWLIMMCTLSVASTVQGYHQYKDVWSEGSDKFCFCFRDRKIDLHTSVLYSHMCKFLSGSREFYKNGDKFILVKYLRLTFNSPKFSPATILCYMDYVCAVCTYILISLHFYTL